MLRYQGLHKDSPYCKFTLGAICGHTEDRLKAKATIIANKLYECKLFLGYYLGG